ncbi:MAG: hypothetical protein S4CHLAM45_04300 [Chlamydiales bacterium]|nr:hypothetical protein [Chlamydiales bacterium]MCH9619284.1 hypothetical protein [Chlamydiales bacterium]MCH9622546.1 hypothetical protein [Chlamydiales bacterium]
MDKKKSFRILWRRFDPIGIYGPGCTFPDNEYNAYADYSYELLKDGIQLKELEEQVRTICHEDIGVETPLFQIEKFSKQLFDFYHLDLSQK